MQACIASVNYLSSSKTLQNEIRQICLPLDSVSDAEYGFIRIYGICFGFVKDCARLGRSEGFYPVSENIGQIADLLVFFYFIACLNGTVEYALKWNLYEGLSVKPVFWCPCRLYFAIGVKLQFRHNPVQCIPCW